jgi:hypothetical protein
LEDRTLPSTFTVLNLNDSGAGSLRQAILDANAHPGPDTIRFASGLHGTITLTSGELSITDDLLIAGPGSSRLTVGGHGTSRVFNVSARNVTIDGLTIADGLATSSSPNGSNGGGIYHGRGTLTLSRDVLRGNRADGTAAGALGYGGAILNASGATLILDHSNFLDNVATGTGRGRGGAIFNYGTATVFRSTFTHNQALGGSTGSPFSSSGSGGAIANLGDQSGATLTVASSTFTGNEAIGGPGTAAGGGAIWNRYAIAPDDNRTLITDSVVVLGSTFQGNRAVGGNGPAGQGGWGLGGAIVVQSLGGPPEVGDTSTDSTLTVTDSTFRNNEADGGSGGGRSNGGAILTNGDLASTTIARSVFAGNRAVGSSGGRGSGLPASDGLAVGGGIATGFGGSLTVTASLFTGNQARGGGDAWGGAIGNQASDQDAGANAVLISTTLFVNNRAVGGPGGNGLGGALFNGSTGYFGGVAEFPPTMTVNDSRLLHNQAVGGNGIDGNGGDGLGGGVFNGIGAPVAVPTVTISNTLIVANQARGGAAGSGGHAGAGIGGGIYNTAVASAHRVFVKGNRASTSDDDVFGTVTGF